MTLRRIEQRSNSQYCSEDGVEFSLPEGVDLVGIDSKSTLRKACSSYNQQHHHPSQHPSAGNTPFHAQKPPKWKSAFKLILINLFVCCLVLGYALIGSFVFLALEGQSKGLPSGAIKVSASGYPMKKNNLTLALWNALQTDQIQQLKNETVKNIWDITLSMNILYQENWTRLTGEEIATFQRTFIDKILQIVESSSTHEVYAWTFPRAFLFALTTLTTIGYGGIGPKTSSAKIATMIYAIFGIPIMLWYLSNVGSLLAKIARFLCAKLCCCCCYEEPPPRRHNLPNSNKSSSTTSTRKPSCTSDPYYQKSLDPDGPLSQSYGDEALNRGSSIQDDNYTSRPPRLSILFILILSVGVLLAYISLGSYIVTKWEKWAFLDGFYFCFLTLTTISFGDIRVQKSGGLERFSTRTEWFCSFYILFGMALTSMFFNILHEEISRKYKLWKDSPLNRRGHPPETNETLATVNRTRRRPVENSYSVHLMNFNSPSNTTGSRNFTEETILSEGHCKPRGGAGGGGGGGGLPSSDSSSKMYDDEEVPTDYIVAHPIPPPREIYGSHPVFPR